MIAEPETIAPGPQAGPRSNSHDSPFAFCVAITNGACSTTRKHGLNDQGAAVAPRSPSPGALSTEPIGSPSLPPSSTSYLTMWLTTRRILGPSVEPLLNSPF